MLIGCRLHNYFLFAIYHRVYLFFVVVVMFCLFLTPVTRVMSKAHYLYALCCEF